MVVFADGPLARAADVPARNAALQYWLAFDRFDSRVHTAESHRLLNEWEKVEFSPENVKLLDQMQPALVYLHRGAELDDCVWPSALNVAREGLNVYTPQHRARPLAALAVLRARYRLEQGRPEAGFADVLAVMKLARHVAADGGIIALIIGEAIEMMATRCVAGSLWAVKDPDVLRIFLHRWDRLPKAPTTAAILTAERDKKIAWFKTCGVDAGSDTEPDLAGNPAPRDRTDRMATKKYRLGLQTAAGSVKEFTTALDREYSQAIEIAKLPLDEIAAAETELGKRREKALAQSDEMVRVCIELGMPPVYNLRLREARSDTVRAMLRAAVATKADGKDIAEASKDPYSDGPFQVTKTETGYELRSKLNALIPEGKERANLGPIPAVLSVRTVRATP